MVNTYGQSTLETCTRKRMEKNQSPSTNQEGLLKIMSMQNYMCAKSRANEETQIQKKNS